MYQIEKNVPLYLRQVRNSTVYPYKDMEIGDSFLIDPTLTGDNRKIGLIQSNAIAAFNWLKKNNPHMKNWRIKTASKDGKIRVWRIK